MLCVNTCKLKLCVFALSVILIHITNIVSAQDQDKRYLRGVILDEKGETIPFATVYISELKTGIAADKNGKFSLLVQQGVYHGTVSSLGFVSKSFTVTIVDSDIENRVVLSESVFILDEVIVSPDKEDRAYAIIRRAVEKAPFYRMRVKRYLSENYIKGSFSVGKLPKVLTVGASKDELNLVMNRVFVLESVSDIEYISPGTYNKKVKAFSSTLPEQIDPTLLAGSTDANVYEEKIYGVISPISREAMQYYTFKYEGFINEDDRIIYKILVSPKKSSPQLMAGRIFIVDEKWSVDNIEMAIFNEVGRYNIKQRYQEFANEIYLPIASTIVMEMSFMGVKFSGNYYSSFKYIDIEPNMDYINFKKRADKITVKRDTIALVKDSLYWEGVRNVPLSIGEKKSYREADSVKRELEKIKSRDSLKDRQFVNAVLKPALLGKRYKIAKNTTFSFSGLSSLFSNYNFVDGYCIGQSFSLDHQFSDGSKLYLKPYLSYAYNRRVLLWESSLMYAYFNSRASSKISFGRTSEGINDVSKFANTINSFLSYLVGNSKISYYEKSYMSLSNTLALSNGIEMAISLSHSRVSPLDNAVQRSLFGKKPNANQRENYYGDTLTYHSKNSILCSLGYKSDVSWIPSLSLTADFALGGANGNSKYIRAELSVVGEYKLNIFSRINYFVNSGFFPLNSRMYLSDYKYFDTNLWMLSAYNIDTSFSLLNNCYYPARGGWVQSHINLYSDYLLIKRLSFIHLPFFEEGLHLKYMSLPAIDHSYSEIGYSIGEKHLLKAGLFFGFINWRYDSWGIRISIPILSKISIAQ